MESKIRVSNLPIKIQHSREYEKMLKSCLSAEKISMLSLKDKTLFDFVISQKEYEKLSQEFLDEFGY